MMDPVLIQALAPYKHKKLLYFFALIRSWHADYELIEKHCPRKGTIIDVGCGYGMFARYLGLKSPERKVCGIEINQRKLALAPRDLPNVTFTDKPLSQLESQSVECIVFYGMLHHLESYAQQEEMLKDALRVLKSDGRLIVIDIDSRPLWKFVICWFVDHTLYFDDRIYFRFRESMLELLEKRLKLNVRTFMCDSKAPLPHIAYIASPQPLAGELVFR